MFRHYPNWQWDQLSPSYINGPRLVLDEAIITTPRFDNVKPKVITCSKENESKGEIDSIGPERENPDINSTEQHCNELPAHRRKEEVAVSSLPEKKRRSCRDLLSELRNLTYHIQEHDALNQLEEDLGRILTLAKKRVPSDGGLTIEGQSSRPLNKRSKQGGKNDAVQKKRFNIRFKELPKPIKGKHKYSGRHGSRATMIRQTIQVHVPTSTSLSSQHQATSASLKQSLQHPRVQQASHPHSTASKQNYPRKDMPLQSTVSNPVSSTQQPNAQPYPTTTSHSASSTQQPNAQPQPTTKSHSASSTQQPNAQPHPTTTSHSASSTQQPNSQSQPKPQVTLQAVHSKLMLSHTLQPQVTLQAVHSNLMLSHSLQPQVTLQAVHSNLIPSHILQPQVSLQAEQGNLSILQLKHQL